MKKIILTGAGGQLGKEFQKQLVLYDYQVVPVDLSAFDITDFSYVREFLQKEKPDIVINCAAYTDVDGCEENEELAFKVNALGVKNLAIVTAEMDTELVHISTDYVFDGESGKVYREYDKPAPLNIYGKSKLMGEEFVERFNPRHYIVRTAWLYGEGKNFVQTMLRLSRERESIKVVNDQFGTPTSTVDLTSVIIDLIGTEYYGLYHGTCEGYCNWYDFAIKIFQLKGIDIEVNPVTTAEFKRPARRPKFSVLDNYMLKLAGLNNFKNWEEALEEYLENIE